MNLSFYIAKRYLFSKKSHNAINIISMISVCGIAIATMAMVCALSIFNGFTQLVSDSFSVMDPDLQIVAAKGKIFDPTDSIFSKIKEIPEIAQVSEILEDNALAKYGERQEPILVKGVSNNFNQMVNTDRLIINGDFLLHDGDVDFCVAGVGVAVKLGLVANNITPIEIYSPKRDVKVQLANPSSAFTTEYTYPSGIFALNQAKYDDQVLLVSLEQARKLFRYTNEVSSLSIKLKNENAAKTVKNKLKKILGSNFIIKDRFEQQAESFKMVNIEKWVTFFILSFILIIAAFNIVGSLSMLIIDKTNDINTLRNMGANDKLITQIFRIQGWLISMSGAIVGIIIGVTLSLIQEHFGILKLSQDPSMFITAAYPIKVELSDIAIIFVVVCSISSLIVLYPVNNLRRKLNASK